MENDNLTGELRNRDARPRRFLRNRTRATFQVELPPSLASRNRNPRLAPLWILEKRPERRLHAFDRYHFWDAIEQRTTRTLRLFGRVTLFDGMRASVIYPADFSISGNDANVRVELDPPKRPRTSSSGAQATNKHASRSLIVGWLTTLCPDPAWA
jgi:hypothetical protein